MGTTIITTTSIKPTTMKFSTKAILSVTALATSVPSDAKVNAFEAFWYRPHHECGQAGTNPDQAINLVHTQMDVTGDNGVDFVGLSEAGGIAGGISRDSQSYDVIGAVCGSGGSFVSPIALLYNWAKWDKIDSWPRNDVCQNGDIPTATPTGQYLCGLTDVTPSDTNCCSCTFSADEITQDDNIGQRPFVIGKFSSREYSGEIPGQSLCVVAAAMTHPSHSHSIATLNSAVAQVCGDSPILYMADTNLSGSSQSISSLFESEPLRSLHEQPHPPHTCCNEAQPTRFASDRIAVTQDLWIDNLYGGSTYSGGDDYPSDFGYACQADEEHLPILASVSFRDNDNDGLDDGCSGIRDEPEACKHGNNDGKTSAVIDHIEANTDTTPTSETLDGGDLAIEATIESDTIAMNDTETGD